MNLFIYFSLTSSFFFLSVGESKTILETIQTETQKKHSVNLINFLKKILEKNHRQLREVKEVYFTSGPGSQTGIRLSLVFVSTLQTLNPEIKIFHLNTLLFQASDQNCLSLLSLDNSGRRWHLAGYQKQKEILSSQIKTKEEIEEIKKKFSSFPVIENFRKINFLEHFKKLKEVFFPLNEQEIKKIVNKFLQ